MERRAKLKPRGLSAYGQVGEQSIVPSSQGVAPRNKIFYPTQLRDPEGRLDVRDAVVVAEGNLFVVPGTSDGRRILAGSRVIPCVRSSCTFSYRSSRLVRIIPPSPVVMILTGWKLSTVMSEKAHDPIPVPW